jgi:hypothetical protein
VSLLDRKSFLAFAGAVGGLAPSFASAAMLRPAIGRNTFPVGAGQGPYKVVAYPGNIGFVILDKLGNELIGIRWTSGSAPYRQFYYRSSYFPASGLINATYPTAENQTVSLGNYGMTTTASNGVITTTHPYGSVTITPTGGTQTSATHTMPKITQFQTQQSAPELYCEKIGKGQGGGGGGIPLIRVGGIGGDNAVGCTIGSVAMIGAFGGTAALGLAGAAELGLNVFVDAGFIGMFNTFLASWASWDSSCFTQ